MIHSSVGCEQGPGLPAEVDLMVTTGLSREWHGTGRTSSEFQNPVSSSMEWLTGVLGGRVSRLHIVFVGKGGWSYGNYEERLLFPHFEKTSIWQMEWAYEVTTEA